MSLNKADQQLAEAAKEAPEGKTGGSPVGEQDLGTAAQATKAKAKAKAKKTSKASQYALEAVVKEQKSVADSSREGSNTDSGDSPEHPTSSAAQQLFASAVIGALNQEKHFEATQLITNAFGLFLSDKALVRKYFESMSCVNFKEITLPGEGKELDAEFRGMLASLIDLIARNIESLVERPLDSEQKYFQLTLVRTLQKVTWDLGIKSRFSLWTNYEIIVRAIIDSTKDLATQDISEIIVCFTALAMGIFDTLPSNDSYSGSDLGSQLCGRLVESLPVHVPGCFDEISMILTHFRATRAPRKVNLAILELLSANIDVLFDGIPSVPQIFKPLVASIIRESRDAEEDNVKFSLAVQRILQMLETILEGQVESERSLDKLTLYAFLRNAFLLEGFELTQKEAIAFSILIQDRSRGFDMMSNMGYLASALEIIPLSSGDPGILDIWMSQGVFGGIFSSDVLYKHWYVIPCLVCSLAWDVERQYCENGAVQNVLDGLVEIVRTQDREVFVMTNEMFSYSRAVAVMIWYNPDRYQNMLDWGIDGAFLYLRDNILRRAENSAERFTIAAEFAIIANMGTSRTDIFEDVPNLDYILGRPEYSSEPDTSDPNMILSMLAVLSHWVRYVNTASSAVGYFLVKLLTKWGLGTSSPLSVEIVKWSLVTLINSATKPDFKRQYEKESKMYALVGLIVGSHRGNREIVEFGFWALFNMCSGMDMTIERLFTKNKSLVQGLMDCFEHWAERDERVAARGCKLLGLLRGKPLAWRTYIVDRAAAIISKSIAPISLKQKVLEVFDQNEYPIPGDYTWPST